MRKHLPLILVLAITAIGLIRIAMYNWREGTVLLGGALLLAGLLRALLPADRIGTVAIRSRPVDVLLYTGLGLMVMAVSLTITGGPFDQ
jgi:Protein of unknown function (DUF3017)